jgi:hypothetical protein
VRRQLRRGHAAGRADGRVCAQGDERLLRLYESGLPAWAVHAPLWGVFYRPWLRRAAFAAFVAVSAFSMAVGFYDLLKNVPFLHQARAPRRRRPRRRPPARAGSALPAAQQPAPDAGCSAALYFKAAAAESVLLAAGHLSPLRAVMQGCTSKPQLLSLFCWLLCICYHTV